MGTFAPYEVPGIHMGPDGRRIPNGATPEDFKPKHLCLVYLKFELSGIVAKHAYFDLPVADLRGFAMSEFQSVMQSGNWATFPIRQEVNFENFTFGSQHLIAFFIDPTGTRAVFDKNNPVQFAEWSARDPQAPATRKALNNSFLNAEIRDWYEREVLMLENWFVDENGQPIIKPLELLYAMNIHLLSPCVLQGSPGSWANVPVIIDPDTGNGAGNEP